MRWILLPNRLEAAGHITRTREHSDRRVVTLRSGGHVQERTDEFSGPLAGRLDAATTPSPFLEQAEASTVGLNTTMGSHLAEQDALTPRSSQRPH
ncbi:hypothetical protein [Streptomyces roseolus]|uniref:hypothetical protein n=1 Tax=Streptomyces roseolus TaxID=67358 RepID=UPI003F4CD6AE